MKQDHAIQRGTLDGVEAFVRVAERRSFRGAAADLGVTPSAVSQAVRALEARVGIALFTRTTRSVGLTEAGERFLERALPAFQEIVAASNAAANHATAIHNRSRSHASSASRQKIVISDVPRAKTYATGSVTNGCAANRHAANSSI